ncbi:MAG: response regulator [Polyangiaceae bacterium]
MSEDNPLVLVIEDEEPVQVFLHAALTSRGYRVAQAFDAASGLASLTSAQPRVVLLDLGLPDRDGLGVVREVREWAKIPIIVLSARGREDDKVEALDAGADDYLTKPFGVNELLARVRVALRHEAGAAPLPNFTAGPLQIDLAKHKVTLRGKRVRLTPIEYQLLVLLMKHRGKVLTHRQLLTEVWGPTEGAETHYLRVYMAQLRRKLEDEPARPQLLLTELGVGYRLRDVDEEGEPSGPSGEGGA